MNIRDDARRNLFVNGVDVENGVYGVVELEPETYTFGDLEMVVLQIWQSSLGNSVYLRPQS